MALNANKPKAPQVPEDTHPAIIAQIIDKGNQFKTDFASGDIETYDDGNPKIVHEVWITFEFPTVTHTFDERIGPQPLWVSKNYTVSTHEKSSMYELLTALGIKDGDLTKAAGQIVLATTGMTSGGNAKITSISRAKASVLVGEEVIKTSTLSLAKEEGCTLYEVEDGENDVFKSLPTFLQEQITNQATKEGFFNDSESEQQQSQY